MKEEKPMKIHNRIHKYKAEYYHGNKKITKKEYETSQNIIDLQAENAKLKQKLEEQTKTYQKILEDKQEDIDQLERNYDVFIEQMNDAVGRTVELNDKIYNAEKMIKRKIEIMKQHNAYNKYFYDIKELKEVLNELGLGDDTDE